MPDDSETPQRGADVLAALQRLTERQGGDARYVAELLYRENHDAVDS